MKFVLVLAALVASVSANDVKGLKYPSGNRNYFMPPSRRAVAYPVNDGKTVKQSPYDDVKGYVPAQPQQEPVKGYEPVQTPQEPVNGYEPVKPNQPVKGYEPVRPYQEPVKGYEPQRPVFQKPVEQQVKGQRPEFNPIPQAPQSPDTNDQADGFDGPTQPAFGLDSPDSDGSLAPQAPAPSAPVPQAPIPQKPVPQTPFFRSPSARKPYYQPQIPQSPQEPQQQVYQTQIPQEPQQRYDVPLIYGRRPATTLLRTPNGFQLSPGLAAYPIV